MRVIRERTAIAGVSDLRSELEAILRQIKECPVELEKHSKPVAILIDPKQFFEMRELLDQAEDLLLALEAQERRSKRARYVDLSAVEKKFGR